MLFINNLRKEVTTQLETLQVFYPYDNNILSIKETESSQGNKKNSTPLKEVIVQNLPTENIWIFENEYAQLDSKPAKEQKGAFSSTGKKVEKTILYLKDEKLHVFMIEMKESLLPNKFSSTGKESIPAKFVDSFNHILVFLAASTHFEAYENLHIIPVGICCYNYDFECENIDINNVNYSESRGKFVKYYTEQGKRAFIINIDPLLWGNIDLPVIFYKNIHNPLKESFDIDFQDFFTKLRTI